MPSKAQISTASFGGRAKGRLLSVGPAPHTRWLNNPHGPTIRDTGGFILRVTGLRVYKFIKKACAECREFKLRMVIGPSPISQLQCDGYISEFTATKNRQVTTATFIPLRAYNEPLP